MTIPHPTKHDLDRVTLFVEEVAVAAPSRSVLTGRNAGGDTLLLEGSDEPIRIIVAVGSSGAWCWKDWVTGSVRRCHRWCTRLSATELPACPRGHTLRGASNSGHLSYVGFQGILPLKTIPDHIEDPADHPPIIYSRHTVRYRERGFDPVQLLPGQQN